MLSFLWLVSATSACLAADPHLRKTLPPDELFTDGTVYSWAGTYAGADAGFDAGRAAHKFDNNAPAGSSSPKGAVGGGYAGFNLQFNQIMLGVEGDIQLAGLKGSFNNASGITSSGSSKLGWEGALRTRIGFAMDRALFYVAGGMAFGQFTYHGGPALAQNCCGYNALRTGYTIGAGSEYAFSDHLVGRLEYRYTNFGKVAGALAPTYPDVAMSVANHDNDFRIGLAYKFGDQTAIMRVR